MAINSAKFSKGLIIGFCVVYLLLGATLGYLTRKHYTSINNEVIGELWNRPILFQSLLTLVVLFSSIFGLVSALKSSPLLLKIFAFLVLAGLVMQVLDQFWFHAVDNEISLLGLKNLMSFFEYIPFRYKEVFQETQQLHRCCGVDQWRDYGQLPRRVPDSCCGKYFGKNFHNIGSCGFEQLETTSGCGGGLFFLALEGIMPTGVSIIYNVMLVLFYGFQALTTTTAWMLAYDLENLPRKPLN